MYLLIIIIFLLVSAILLLLKNPVFGKLPSGKRLEIIKQSPNYKNGAFQNTSLTPDLTEGATYYSVSKEYFFGDKKRRKPHAQIPTIKTDLLQLERSRNILVWFGHSSYFMQIDGKRILVDPVFSGAAGPFSFSNKAFKGSDIYTVEEIPEIDFLFITHDHYDHMDYQTLTKLRPKIGSVICGLGTGSHLELWGYDESIIIEKDWNESFILEHGFTVNTVPGRHFSGRGLKRNQTLWMSFVLQTPSIKIFIGGDSGYDKHFLQIGESFGPFDVAIIENGQYDKSWKYIHLMPEEVLQAATDLKAKRLFPVHSSKFSISIHPWDEPLIKISELNQRFQLPLITPRIGEPVDLKDSKQVFSKWWLEVN